MLGQHERQGRGGHVAVTREHVARFGQRALRQREAMLDRVEHRSAAGMHRPAVDLAARGARRARPRAKASGSRSASAIRPGTSPDKMHREAAGRRSSSGSARAESGEAWRRTGRRMREPRSDRPSPARPRRRRRTGASRAAARSRRSSCRCSVRKLDRHHQHPRAGLASGRYGGRAAQRGDRGVAAHEPDQRPLDRRARPSPRGDDLVDARGDEPGAAGDDEMGDAARSTCSAQAARSPLSASAGAASA